MPRDYESIERDIENARNQLADTLDELAGRTSPKALADKSKAAAADSLQKPAVQAALAGVGALVVAVVIRAIVKR